MSSSSTTILCIPGCCAQHGAPGPGWILYAKYHLLKRILETYLAYLKRTDISLMAFTSGLLPSLSSMEGTYESAFGRGCPAERQSSRETQRNPTKSNEIATSCVPVDLSYPLAFCLSFTANLGAINCTRHLPKDSRAMTNIWRSMLQGIQDLEALNSLSISHWCTVYQVPHQLRIGN